MAVYKKRLKNKNGDIIHPVTTVDTDEINDGAVTTAKIDSEAITTAKVADASVTANKVDFTTVGAWKCLGSIEIASATSGTITFDTDYDMYEIFADAQTSSDSWYDIRALDSSGDDISGVTRNYFYVSSGAPAYSTSTGKPIAVAPCSSYKETNMHCISTNTDRGNWRSFSFQCGNSVNTWIGSSNLGANTAIKGFKLISGVTFTGSLTVFGRNLSS